MSAVDSDRPAAERAWAACALARKQSGVVRHDVGVTNGSDVVTDRVPGTVDSGCWVGLFWRQYHGWTMESRPLSDAE